MTKTAKESVFKSVFPDAKRAIFLGNEKQNILRLVQSKMSEDFYEFRNNFSGFIKSKLQQKFLRFFASAHLQRAQSFSRDRRESCYGKHMFFTNLD